MDSSQNKEDPHSKHVASKAPAVDGAQDPNQPQNKSLIQQMLEEQAKPESKYCYYYIEELKVPEANPSQSSSTTNQTSKLLSRKFSKKPMSQISLQTTSRKRLATQPSSSIQYPKFSLSKQDSRYSVRQKSMQHQTVSDQEDLYNISVDGQNMTLEVGKECDQKTSASSLNTSGGKGDFLTQQNFRRRSLLRHQREKLEQQQRMYQLSLKFRRIAEQPPPEPTFYHVQNIRRVDSNITTLINFKNNITKTFYLQESNRCFVPQSMEIARQSMQKDDSEFQKQILPIDDISRVEKQQKLIDAQKNIVTPGLSQPRGSSTSPPTSLF